jgi:CBS-domain-containing membrane protein
MHRHSLARLLWVAAGVVVAIALVLEFASEPVSPLFLASLGGSAVFLFGLTRAPAVQPRALFGGHLVGALVGITAYQLFGDALWVYVAAQTVAVCLLLALRCVHPPAGANPLIMVHAHASWSALLHPVFASVALLSAVTFVWSRLYPGLVRYPVNTFEPSPPKATWGGWED